VKGVVHGDIDLGEDEQKAPAEGASSESSAEAVRAVKAALGDRVKDVRLSRRLTDSASCLVAEEGAPGANMERIMQMLDRKVVESPRVLELNPQHPIIQNLGKLSVREPGSDRVRQWSELLLDQAMLAEGVVRDPAALVARIQRALTDWTALASGTGGESG
jgi:molecular chaperone HtpG